MSDSDNKSDKQDHQLLLDRFLQKAKPILAAERGLNEKSRAKLKRLADENHVNDEIFDRALQLIKSGDISTNNLSRYERSFVKFLRRELKGLSESILPAKLEQKAIDIAFDKFQLEPQRARELTQLVADELGVSRISRSDSERHVTELVNNLIGHAPYVNEDIRKRLYAAGDQWGMERGYLDSLIIGKLTENRDAETRKRSSALGWLPIVVTSIVVVTATVAFWVWYSQEKTPDRSTGQQETKPEELPLVDRLPSWWSETVKNKFVSMRHDLPVVAAQLESLLSDDAARRYDGYKKLTNAFVDDVDIGSHEKDIAFLLGYFYAHEPSGPFADRWLEDVAGFIELPAGRIPNQPNASERAFRANQLLTVAASSDDISQERLDSIDEVTTRLVGWSVKKPSAIYLSASNEAIARDYWNHLILNAPTDLDAAIAAFEFASVTTKFRLKSDAFSQFQLRFIEAVLDAEPRRFEKLQSYIRDLINDAPAHQLAVLARHVRNIKDSRQQKWLVDRFVDRIKVRGSESPASSIDLIEEHFGVIPPEVVRYRNVYRSWNEMINEQGLKDLIDFNRDPTPVQIANLAHANTVGWYICFDIDSTRLDAKLKQSSINLGQVAAFQSIDRDAPFNVSIIRASNSDQRALRRYVDDLDIQNQLTSSRRLAAVKKLAEISLKFQDLDSAQAKQLATYFCSTELSLEEWANVQAHLPSFSHWPNLLIAVADQVSSPRVPGENAVKIVNRLTNGRIDVTHNQTNWREQLKIKLLGYIANGLQQRALDDKSSVSASWQALKFFLVENIRDRASLLEKPLNSNDRSASSALFSETSLLEQLIELLRAYSPSVEHQRQVSRRYEASKLLSDDEMLQSILMYQWSVEMLAEATKRQQPEFAAEIDSVVNDYHLANQNTNSIGQQLYLCEFAQLKLLQIVNTKK